MRILYVQGHSEHYAMTPHRLFVFQRKETFLKKETASLKIYRYMRTFFDNIA